MPKSRGRPAARDKLKRRQQRPAREVRLSDRVISDAAAIATHSDVLDAERWASSWLGLGWATARLEVRQPESELCLEVTGRASGHPTEDGLAAIAALRRVAPASELTMLDETVEILSSTQLEPPWLNAPAFEAVRAWRAVDIWESERCLFIEYRSADQAATAHTLMAQIVEAGGTQVLKLGVLQVDAARFWAETRDPEQVPMPLSECPAEQALADLAGALRRTDMLWPRPDDPDFVELRALAWARCRDFLPDWPDFEPIAQEERERLIGEFVAATSPPDHDTARSLADLFLDYGEGYITAHPLAFSPEHVELFLVDWLPRKAFLDDAQRAALAGTLRQWLLFALQRRGIPPRWIEPVVAAVDDYLPIFNAALDDESSWGPAKQIAAELAARGVDFTDSAAVDQVIRELNAARLARNLLDG